MFDHVVSSGGVLSEKAGEPLGGDASLDEAVH